MAKNGNDKPVRKYKGIPRGVDRLAWMDWLEFKEDLLNALRVARNQPRDITLAPYFKEHSVLKRMTYQFINKNIDAGRLMSVVKAIENDDDSTSSLKVGEDKNPYYGALSRLSYVVDFLNRGEVSRYAAQLLYARRHKVPPHFLIGFLYQSGNQDYIATKVKDPGGYEEWFGKVIQ